MATLSIIFLFHTLAKLSERFGSVLKMPPLYKWFYAAEAFAGISLLAHLFQANAILASPQQTVFTTTLEFSLLLYHIPLAIAVTIGMVITLKYWGWLIIEQKK